MRVRDARPVDAATVRAIARESWHAAYDDIVGADTVDDRIDDWYATDRLAETIDETATREDASFLVAEPRHAAGETAPKPTLAGFAHAGPDPDVDGAAKLLRIYVRPDAWGDGLGGRLLDDLETDLRDHYDRLRLAVLADNDSASRSTSRPASNGSRRARASSATMRCANISTRRNCERGPRE